MVGTYFGGFGGNACKYISHEGIHQLLVDFVIITNFYVVTGQKLNILHLDLSLFGWHSSVADLNL